MAGTGTGLTPLPVETRWSLGKSVQNKMGNKHLSESGRGEHSTAVPARCSLVLPSSGICWSQICNLMGTECRQAPWGWHPAASAFLIGCL